ncbi:MAG: SPOR domain-containing protein [Ignavibacteriae bacterium]|nr:SPOR domain-containing protein [Ignavibacteriota bacterium]
MNVIRHWSLVINHLVDGCRLAVRCCTLFLIIYLTLLTAHCSTLYGQNSKPETQNKNEVAQAIQLLEKGEVNEVKSLLPELITKYQNDAGVVYLQGRLATNANEAKQFYQTILSNFPKSEWADDALYRLYQYNYAMGLYRTASAQLQQLAKEYPESPYVKSVPKSDLPKVDKPVTVAKEPEVQSNKTETKKTNEQEIKPQGSQERFTLQVGAFSTSVNAEKVKSSFEEKGYKVEVASKVQNGKSLYKVWVGGYKTRDDAEKASKEVKSKFGLSSMVIER